MTEEITDEQRTVLEIRFKNGDKLYLASGSYMAVSNPYNATRYPPLDDKYPNRAESQDKDIKWMKSGFDADISFVPFLKAYKEYRELHKDD